MNEDTHMFYDPKLGKMLALGSKEDIETIAKQYLEDLAFIYEMRKSQKKGLDTSLIKD